MPQRTIRFTEEILLEAFTTGHRIHCARVEKGLPSGCEIVGVVMRDQTVEVTVRGPFEETDPEPYNILMMGV